MNFIEGYNGEKNIYGKLGMNHNTNHSCYNYYQEAQDQISILDKRICLTRIGPDIRNIIPNI
jgi:hypothetical protein